MGSTESMLCCGKGGNVLYNNTLTLEEVYSILTLSFEVSDSMKSIVLQILAIFGNFKLTLTTLNGHTG